jgi:hypothetical protein
VNIVVYLYRSRAAVSNAFISPVAKYTMRAKEFLIEMIVRHREDDPQYVVAHRDSIWLVSDDSPAEVWSEIETKTGVSARDTQSLYDARDERPDVLISYFDYSRLNLDGVVSNLNPVTSKLLKKVAQALNLDGYTVSRIEGEYLNDEWDDEVSRHEMLGDIPEKVYHGTCSKHIFDILRFGLRPVGHSNWMNIGAHFPDRIFLTADINKAAFHANHSAKKTKSRPIIVEATIPDRRRIDLDYDIANTFYGSDHEQVHHSYRETSSRRRSVDDTHQHVQRHSPKTDFSRETGVFSYKGRIPARFINALLLNGTNDDGVLDPRDTFRETNPKDFLENFDLFDEWGIYDEIAFNEYRYNDEDEEEEEDDES